MAMAWAIGTKILITLLFAVNKVIIASDEGDSPYIFRNLQKKYNIWGLDIKTTKKLNIIQIIQISIFLNFD